VCTGSAIEKFLVLASGRTVRCDVTTPTDSIHHLDRR